LQQYLPLPEVAEQRKIRPKVTLNPTPITTDHAAINAGFDFRRYNMKPVRLRRGAHGSQAEMFL
jgi:hypothetical protein